MSIKSPQSVVLAMSLVLLAYPAMLASAQESVPQAQGRAITVQVVTPSSKPSVTAVQAPSAKSVTVSLTKPTTPTVKPPAATAKATPAKPTPTATKPVAKVVVKASTPAKPAAGKAVTATQKLVIPAKTTVKATVTPVKSVASATKPVVAKPAVTAIKPTPAKPIAMVSPSKPTELKGMVLMLQPATKPQPASKEPPAAFLASDDAMLVRSIPLVVTGYAGSAEIPQAAQTAEGVMKVVTSTSSLLPHMEVIRQAQKAMLATPDVKTTLLGLLKDRYLKDPENPTAFFDYGYAQLVLDGNKNGLFFLRKANDKLHSPASCLAYGMAQVDVDRLHEKGTPTELTTRKMDAGYKLKDALVLNRVQKLPGVWPTYIRVMESLKGMSAFDSLRNEDVSAIYVPAGNVSLSRSMPGAFLAMPTAEAAGEVLPPVTGTLGACPVSISHPSPGNLAYTKKVDFLNKGELSTVNFYTTQVGAPYQVQVESPQKQIVGEFTSYKAPYIMEDLDGDNQFELVVRQFDRDPLHPVYVYRWSGSCFAEDMGVSAFFR